ncbi:endonuclease domain-containing protein [Streptomyces roseoverticillatus]|uniref:Endonuclease domain-containing protein n=1 Tax=Streptomyces roseoverticillatus TaxID=66429 RepID=A0ABV3IR73_9ACTN
MAGQVTEICSFQGCGRRFRARSQGVPLCKSHYEQARQGLPLKPIKAKLRAGTYSSCQFNNPPCDRPHSALGYCATHYQQWSDGKPLTPIRGWKSQADWGPTCRYRDCEAEAYSRGLCIVHYGRGISQFARDAIFALQGGRCLCGTPDPGQRGWQLDHAHDCTNEHKPTNYCKECVRGLLCIACNRHAIAWYEGTYMQQQGNTPILVLEEWINRRVQFHGGIDSPDVRVSYVRRVLPSRYDGAS